MDTREEPFEEQYLYHLHDMCDRLKKADRLELITELKTNFQDLNGIGRFIEIEEFKLKVDEVSAKYKKKLPKKRKTVLVSDDDSDWLKKNHPMGSCVFHLN